MKILKKSGSKTLLCKNFSQHEIVFHLKRLLRVIKTDECNAVMIKRQKVYTVYVFSREA